MYTRIQEVVSNVASIIVDMAKGTLIKHSQMQELLKTTDNNDYYRLISKLRSTLKLEYAIFLETIPRIGYRICREGEDAELCVSYLHRGMNKMYKAKFDLNLIQDNEYCETAKQKVAVCRNITNSLMPDPNVIISFLTNLGPKNTIKLVNQSI